METVSPPTLSIFFKIELFQGRGPGIFGAPLRLLCVEDGTVVYPISESPLAPASSSAPISESSVSVVFLGRHSSGLSPTLHVQCSWLPSSVAWSSTAFLSLVPTSTQAPLVPSSTDKRPEFHLPKAGLSSAPASPRRLACGLALPRPCPPASVSRLTFTFHLCDPSR